MRLIFGIFLSLFITNCFAVVRTSTGSTDWGTASTWSPAAVPGSTDTVIISSGHTVTNGANRSCGLLTINGTLNFTANRTINVTGALSVNGDISGTGGTITSTGNLILASNVTNTTVAILLQTTTGLTITGTGSIPTLTINTTTTNNGNITIGTSLAGSSTLTNVGTLIIKGSITITTLTAVSSSNTIEYGGTTQTVRSMTYHNLVISNSGTKTLAGNITTNGTLTISGSSQLDVSTTNYSINLNGNMVNNSSNALPFNARSGTFTIGGTTIGTNTLTGTGTTAFNRISVNKGTDFTNYVFDIQSHFTMLLDGLRITNGTIKFSNTSSSFTPFNANVSTAPNFTIPKTGGFWLNGSNVNYAVLIGMDWYVAGMLRVSAGTLNLGTNTSDNENVVAIDSSAVFKLEGGTINVSGRIGMYNLNSYFQEFNVSGGTLNLVNYSSSTAGRYCIHSNRPGGTLTMSGGSIVIKKECGSGTDDLALLWGGSATITGGTVQLGDASTPASQSFRINMPALYNLNVGSANATGILETDLIIQGDLTVTSGTLDCGSKSINISGSIINDGVFTAGSGTVTFSGSFNETISGSNSIIFNNLILNKSSNKLTLNKSISVLGSLTLNSGNIVTSSTNSLTLTSSATSTSGSSTSFIEGPMIKQGTSSFVFPVGAGGKWMRAEISAPSTSSDFRVQYFNTAYSDIISKSSVIKQVSTKGYWLVDRVSGTGNVQVKLYWEDAILEGINDCSWLTVAHYTSGSWTNTGSCTTTGSCSLGSGTIQTNLSISSFSPFTFASLNTGYNPLPISLVSFEVREKLGKVNIDWVVESENDANFYLCQRSKDGLNFEDVGIVPAEGRIFYNLLDNNPYDGLSYYRLVNIDKNGDRFYYKTVSFTYWNDKIHIYPNPCKWGEKINFTDHESELAITICDSYGKVVFMCILPSGTNELLILPSLEKGMYAIKINNIFKKIIIY